MSTAYGAGPDGMTGTHYGLGTLGVRGDQIPTDGENGPSYMAAWVQPGDEAKEFRGRVIRMPAAGTLVVQENGAFDYTGAPLNSTNSFDVQPQVDGIDFGSFVTIPLTIGAVAAVVGGNATEGDDSAGGGASGPVPVVSVGGNATEGGDQAAGGASGSFIPLTLHPSRTRRIQAGGVNRTIKP
jgi:hypothetical protein